ncbi:MAG: DUF3305 domain-containing protein [Herminiimonas sp.]|nr:DUF3305 domain-containing protein [Herminiimonas sp.]
MESDSLAVGVVMQRFAIVNRWQSHQWRPLDIITAPADLAAGTRRLPDEGSDSADDCRWLFTGFDVRLFSDEAEGYFLNVSAPLPCWFIMSRFEERDGTEVLTPQRVTLSYNEAARLMDGGERVDTLPLPVAMLEPMNAFIQIHYKPEVKRKRKKPSFEGGAGVDLMARAEGSGDGR